MPNSAITSNDVLSNKQVRDHVIHIQAAIHQFFKALTAHDHYAVMLGGALPTSKLNQKIFIARQPQHSLCLKDGKLQYQDFSESSLETIPIQNPAELFRYLKQQTWTQQAFFFASYEFYRYCDPAFESFCINRIATKNSDDPDLFLINFEEILQFDCETLTWNWGNATVEKIKLLETLWLDCIQSGIKADYKLQSKTRTPESYLNEFYVSFSKNTFEHAVSKIHHHIQQGDLYQANLSLCLEKEIAISCPYHLYEKLCLQNPSPFSAFVKTPESILISNSPERLVCDHLDDSGSHTLETRPIAGTRGRGLNQSNDEKIAESLLRNEKERAEHLMLVDLLRNDLGRVCLAGSVAVDECFTIERYSHVMHLVSNIVGTTKQESDAWTILRALFPGGTITGCPKIRCIQILSELEPIARGFYTGSLGYLNTDSEKVWGESTLDWNILIRTLKLTPLASTNCLETRNDPSAFAALRPTLPYNDKPIAQSFHVRLHVGAGIVADSIASHEYRECYRKAEALLGALYDVEQCVHREY